MFSDGRPSWRGVNMRERWIGRGAGREEMGRTGIIRRISTNFGVAKRKSSFGEKRGRLRGPNTYSTIAISKHLKIVKKMGKLTGKRPVIWGGGALRGLVCSQVRSQIVRGRKDVRGGNRKKKNGDCRSKRASVSSIRWDWVPEGLGWRSRGL